MKPDETNHDTIESHDPDLYNRVLKAAHARCEREGHVWMQPNCHESTVDDTGLMTLRSGKYVMARYRLRGDRLMYITMTGTDHEE
jgi:hypothetical protein